MKGLRNGIIVAIVAIVALGLFLAPVRGQEGTGRVKGTVRLGESPLAGARVLLGSSADSRFGQETSTDAEGSFLVQAVPLGVVKINVFADGKFVVMGEGILERPGETITVLLQAEP
ncbi:MAG TPA: carboxypeptidase-like regulatory domain-containing protein [Thermoanaerobaculia bacterium]|jgi:hypothetical protein|nr:carboxypeptidase-like regulatory domain-containing protein [Thermoanaerobaculia bacterium]